RLAALLIACVAVYFLYRWFHVVEDVNEQFSYSESQGNPAASGGSLQISSEAMRDKLKGVVKSQLTAFRDDDYVTAYTFAAAGIKTKYPLAAFERMVKTGFPAIARFKSAAFGVVLDNGQEAVVSVEIEGESNRATHYQYFLRK